MFVKPINQRTRSGQPSRRALTLIELVLVLVILSILATVALEMVEPQVDQTRFEASQRTSNNVRDAIFDEQLLADGRTIYTGFLVDMGRAPATRVDPIDNTLLTASELWEQATLPSYAAVQASTSNITTTDEANNKDADDDSIVPDTDVHVRFGWRGPYLQLTSGASNLFDGFGHRLTSSTTSADLSHLRADGDGAITAVSTAFYGARSFGRSDTLDTGANSDVYENDVPSASAGQILGKSQVEGTVSGTVTYHTTGATTDDIVVQVFYPNGEKIVVQRASNEASSGGVAEIEETTPASVTTYQTFKYTFRDATGAEMSFPVGPRVIRAYSKIGDATQKQSAVVSFTLVSPDNIQNLAVND